MRYTFWGVSNPSESPVPPENSKSWTGGGWRHRSGGHRTTVSDDQGAGHPIDRRQYPDEPA